MKTHGSETRLLVLIPHRDARLPLRAWSGALFTAGIEGAWSFPWAAPLAILREPLGEGELKRLAHILREHILERSNDGKIHASPAVGTAAFPGLAGTAILGPVLDIEIPAPLFTATDTNADASAHITHQFSPLVIGAAMLNGPLPPALPPPPIAFRAAALANMRFRPLPSNDGTPDGYSFEWSIGKPCWLPSVRKHKGI